MISRFFIPVFLVSLQYVTADFPGIEELESAIASCTGDSGLQFCELATKCGYQCDTYYVITADGYNLTVFNIRGNRSRPVFFQHGFLDSADTWLIRQSLSWVAFLAGKFDLWFGNSRGNKHSRKHVSLDPDHDQEFWDFSFHEMAEYDVPATVDFILETTGQTQLQLICHSQGTTIVFVLGCIKPEYIPKFKIVIVLAPVARLDHAEWPLFSLISLAGGPLLSGAVGFLGKGELLRNSSAAVVLLQAACTKPLIGYVTCGLGLASVLYGADPGQFEPEFERKVFCYYPAGTSVKGAVHFLLIIQTKKFAQYNYGVLKNYEKYNSAEPPEYDLSKNTMPFALFAGKNDRLSDLRDVDWLKAQLPNVVEYTIMEPDLWNHVDFVWGKYMKEYLFDDVLNLLNKYN